jgi:hypothetical protein
MNESSLAICPRLFKTSSRFREKKSRPMPVRSRYLANGLSRFKFLVMVMKKHIKIKERVMR